MSSCKSAFHVPKPRHLPSGSWFIQLCVDGRRISVTEKSEDACIARAAAIKAGLLDPVDRSLKPTLRTCIDSYIDRRKDTLSPATIRGYHTIQRNRFRQAMDRPINSYDAAGWQDDNTMKKIYTHVSQRDRLQYADKFAEFFEEGG